MSSAVAHPAARTMAGRRGVVALVCVGMFMTTLDASIVSIGLPSIARAFGAPLGWLVAARALQGSARRSSWPPAR